MSKLYNKHAHARWYHPVTMMCYRSKNGNYEFFCNSDRLFKKDSWKKSGMKTGFRLINTLF